ncbi:hypothetical protein KBX00_17650 [Micromonospora sp. C95]|nr:hypothetical protein [Micromonospora sp. C95]
MILTMRSVQRRILPKPFSHEFVRSTTHRLPTWTGAGTPLRAFCASKPISSSSSRFR